MVFELNVKDNASVTFKKIDQNVVMLQGNLQKADKITNNFNKSLGGLGMTATHVAGRAIIAAISGVGSLAREMIDSYDSTAKLSQNIGITAESVLGLRLAADVHFYSVIFYF